MLSPKEKERAPKHPGGYQGSSKTLSPDSSMSSDEKAGSVMSSLGPGAKFLITLLSGSSHPTAMRMAHFKAEQRVLGKVTVILASVSQHFPPLKTLTDLESFI